LDLKVELKSKDLAPEKRQELQRESEKTAKALEVFKNALDKADIPVAQKKEIADLRGEVFSTDRYLVDKRVTLSADELQVKRVKRDGLVTALIGRETRFFKEAATAVADGAQSVQDRRDLYQQLLNDAKTAANKDPASYWRDVKKTFLEGVEAVSGKELRSTLDKVAFDSKLADQLNGWNNESKKTRLDPARLQELASNLEAIINSYSQRTDVALRKEADPALASVDLTSQDQ